MIPSHINWHEFLMTMAALIICITIHEFSHALSAWRAGDDTPKKHGRISLNPLDHLDPVGTFMMFITSLTGFGIGWGKPVRINPYNFRSPRWDNLKVSLWGPLSNLLTAAVTGTAVRFLWHASHPSQFMNNSIEFLFLITLISISLAVFNLIPVAPLDGSHIVSSLLPYDQARRYDTFMARYGLMVFLGLIFLAPTLLHADVLGMIIGPPARFLVRLLVGV